MTDHEKLQGLAKFIVEFSKQPGNEWLYDELFSLIEENSDHNILNEHPKFRTVYNHCVEEVLNDYAEKSYANFQFQELAENLKKDFVKMETARQNGNLKLFILHCFQQVEEIANFIYHGLIINQWNELKTQKSKIIHYKKTEAPPILERVIFPKYINKYDEEVDELINFKEKGWNISKKFEVSFYILVAINRKEKHFFDARKWFKELNQLRNWAAHRGKITSEDILQRVAIYQGNPVKDFSYFTNGLLNFINPSNLEN